MDGSENLGHWWVGQLVSFFLFGLQGYYYLVDFYFLVWGILQAYWWLLVFEKSDDF